MWVVLLLLPRPDALGGTSFVVCHKYLCPKIFRSMRFSSKKKKHQKNCEKKAPGLIIWGIHKNPLIQENMQNYTILREIMMMRKYATLCDNI